MFITSSIASEAQKLQRDNSPYITQEQASQRSDRISDVHYQLDFTLTEQSGFSGITKVSFDLSDNDRALSLDLNQAVIKRFVINGKKVYPNYNNSYIKLNPRLLNSGSNTIEVEYTRQYSNNGEGLHQFIDPVDNKVYLYSHFEPAAAQQMFAVFDQPDLKATFQLSVTAPKDWTVISAMRESQITAQGEQRRWQFPQSPKLSPYNFSMHAGPYHSWQDNSGKYPLRLFARQSVADKVNQQDWFRYTQQGLNYFDNYFGIEYPFKKYDQVLVPDFLYGAMENAAAITYSESRFLSDSEMTHEQKKRLANVIMHEMAHQWFGNLVTMKWWNGLWLNESFAAFMATQATSQATEFKNAWRSFYANQKQSAYQLDSSASTHPIEVPVASSKHAFDNIDAITYSKGAASLKQLNHLVSEKVFQQGINHYLTKYRYQNAELADFISSLEQASKRDLSQWSQDWLYRAGVNTIEAEFSCSNGRIDRFTLKQSATNPEHNTLREQKVLVGLFTNGRRQLHHNISMPVSYSGQSTEVSKLVGLHCPDLVYPNYQDWGFVKVSLDPVSFKTAQTNLAKVQDPFLRSMLWQSLWDSVENGKLTLNDYMGTVLVNLPKETDNIILEQVLTSLTKARVHLDKMHPSNQRYAKMSIRAIEQMSLRKVMVNSANRDVQRRWFNTYIEFARSKQALDHLDTLLSKTATIKGLTFDQALRWGMIVQLNRHDHRNARYWLKQEQIRDKSDSGQKSALAAEAALPAAAKKRQWLTRVQQPTNMPFAKIRTVMDNLYPSEQKRLSAATAEQRLVTLAQLDSSKGPVFMRSYNSALIPTDCTYASISSLKQLLSAEPNLSPLTQRALKDAIQQEQTCLLIKTTMKH
ncbi:aminopeptidase N [Shewanella pneumatophori]|uniref:Aminopeptidase N n=1 Tax=Shewanella pneumatophori TaxID=314092 RepID=A0A9X1ZF05_9GAMM|nr:aminopeptidase N [Shewanella pneumatophori]MCL1138682.1 aminopeptidase N [Shewanella pneumatophori]